MTVVTFGNYRLTTISADTAAQPKIFQAWRARPQVTNDNRAFAQNQQTILGQDGKKNKNSGWERRHGLTGWWVTVKRYQDQDGPVMGQIKGGPPEATSRTEDWTWPIKSAKNLWRERFQVEQDVYPFPSFISLSLSHSLSWAAWSNLVFCCGGTDTTFANPSPVSSQSSTPTSARSCASSTRTRNTPR